MLLSAEIDACDSITGELIELKAKNLNRSIGRNDKFRKKAWLQSFYAGCTSIFEGIKVDSGAPGCFQIGEIHKYQVANLVSVADRQTLLARVHRVLAFLSTTVKCNRVYLLQRARPAEVEAAIAAGSSEPSVLLTEFSEDQQQSEHRFISQDIIHDIFGSRNI